MNRAFLKSTLLAGFGLSCSLLPAAGALTAVFEYSFPASYSGNGQPLIDQSGAGNDGSIDLPATGGYLADERPPMFLTGGSLTGASGGHGATNAIDLLDNAVVAAAGGFTMETWFSWEGTFTDVRKLIDYAGTEYVRTFDSQIQFGLSNGATVIGAPIVANQWYHVRAEFDSLGNAVDGDGNLAGEARIFLDGTLVGEQAAVKTAFGDSLDRPIGINRWAGGGGDWNQGAIYDPAVYLGVIPEPSPALLSLFSAGALLLVRRRRAR